MRLTPWFLIFLTSGLMAQTLPNPPSSLTLDWDIPITDSEGNPITTGDLSGYTITNSCEGEDLVIPNPETTSQNIPLLIPMDCQFTITAVDRQGLRSEPSNTVRARLIQPVAPVLRITTVSE